MRDELRCPEIALLLNKRESTARKHLSRSICFLRQIYQQAECRAMQSSAFKFILPTTFTGLYL